jgi:hypothetical protein
MALTLLDPMDMKKIEVAASQIENEVINAMGEIGDTSGMSILERECAADKNFEDVSLLMDIAGDKIFDAACSLFGNLNYNSQKVVMTKIGEEILRGVYGRCAFGEAIEYLINGWTGVGPTGPKKDLVTAEKMAHEIGDTLKSVVDTAATSLGYNQQVESVTYTELKNDMVVMVRLENGQTFKITVEGEEE